MRASALLCAGVLLVAACGGEDEPTQAEATSSVQAAAGPTYVEAGNAACAAATAALQEPASQLAPIFLEDRFPPGAVAPYEETASEMATIIESLAASLADLEPPSDRDITADQLVSYLESEVTALREIQEAAANGTELDPRIQTGLTVEHLARLGIAESAGLNECAVRLFGARTN